jgi:hypothetical protein
MCSSYSVLHLAQPMSEVNRRQPLHVRLTLLFAALFSGCSQGATSQPMLAATPTAAPVVARFEVCYENETWERPTVADEAAHIGAVPRYKNVRVDDESFEAKFFRQVAYLWDTKASSAGGDLVALSGLWSDPDLPGARCPTERVVLIGYAPTGLGVIAESEELLDVAPARGYRLLTIAGPRPSRVVVRSANRTLAEFRLQ